MTPGRSARESAGHWLDQRDFLAETGTRLQQRHERAGEDALLVLRLRDLDEFRAEHGLDECARLLVGIRDLFARVLRRADRCCALASGLYAVLLPELRNEMHAQLAAQRLQRAFREELQLDQRVVPMEVAIGLCSLDPDEPDPERMLCRADRASLRALHRQVPIESHVESGGDPFIPVQHLREAIAGNRLQVFMQKLWHLREHRVVGVESLARWHSRRHGEVSATRFVAMAEHSDLIAEFSRWSLNASLRQFAALLQHRDDLHLAINFSPRLFAHDDIAEQVLAALKVWDVPATSLVLEVTESAVLEDPRRSTQILGQFHDAGVGIAIDDFGTGHSSFTYLKQFPATVLKIDQSFVRDMVSDTRSRQLVHSMIDLAHHLDLTVVAEGVEDAATMELLASLDCDVVQGYFIARPQPAETVLLELAGEAAGR